MNFGKIFRSNSHSKKTVLAVFLMIVTFVGVTAQESGMLPSKLIMSSFDTALIAKDLHASILFKFSVSDNGDAYDVEIVNRMKDNIDEEELGGVIEAENVKTLDAKLEAECIRLIEKANWSNYKEPGEEIIYYNISFNYGRVFAH